MSKNPESSDGFIDKLKTLFGFVLIFFVACALSYVVYSDVKEAVLLASHGKATVGTFGKYHYRTSRSQGRSRTTTYQTIYYDGHSKAIAMNKHCTSGSSVDVVYLPEAPSVVRLAEDNATFWQLLGDNNTSGFWLMAGFDLFLIFLLLLGLIGLFMGDCEEGLLQKLQRNRKVRREKQDESERWEKARFVAEEARRRAFEEEVKRREDAENSRRAKERQENERRRAFEEENERQRYRDQQNHARGQSSGHVKNERYYADVLDLEVTASAEDVRRRYKELATQYHPDKVNHLGKKLRDLAATEMVRINEAYEYFKCKFGIR